jgi:hypothetical protein
MGDPPLRHLPQRSPWWLGTPPLDYHASSREGSRYPDRIEPSVGRFLLCTRDNLNANGFSMRNYPRWSGLKHFDNVTHLTFTDAEQYLHVLKVRCNLVLLLLCTQTATAVHPSLPLQPSRTRPPAHPLHPRLSAVLHHGQPDRDDSRPPRASQALHRDVREVLRGALRFQSVSHSPAHLSMQAITELTEPPKDWNFPKQHLKAHVVDDIWQVGIMANCSTRPGEGMHQEVREEYQQTNFKEVVEQVRSAFCKRLTNALICILTDHAPRRRPGGDRAYSTPRRRLRSWREALARGARSGSAERRSERRCRACSSRGRGPQLRLSLSCEPLDDVCADRSPARRGPPCPSRFRQQAPKVLWGLLGGGARPASRGRYQGASCRSELFARLVDLVIDPLIHSPRPQLPVARRFSIAARHPPLFAEVSRPSAL